MVLCCPRYAYGATLHIKAAVHAAGGDVAAAAPSIREIVDKFSADSCAQLRPVQPFLRLGLCGAHS